MDCKSLMIGDWVMLDKTYPPTSKKPTQLTLTDLIFIERKKGEECEPIPLTEEILEKNGLECKNERISIEYQGEIAKDVWLSLQFSSLSYEHWNLRLSKCEEDGTFNIFLHIQYVHELQHALRLCGLNEFADNFKV